MTEQPQPAGWSRPLVLDALDADEVADVERLAELASAADGGHAVSEAAVLALRDAASGARHLLLRAGAPSTGADRTGGRAGDLVGYAQLPADGSGAELVVLPGARRRGAGGVLAEALEGLGGGVLRVWAHGGSPAAAALAARRGYRRVRELQRRSRPLGPEAPLPAMELPDDVQLRAFEVGRDEAAWLDLNARAFVDHPEQGRWTADDLAVRLAEPWFDPAGLLLALDAQGGRLLASHWTKQEPGSAEGEVYVVAVDPAAQGRGLGRSVVLAGLHHLQARGSTSAELYVEGDNAAALRLYGRLGFEVAADDALYERGGDGGAAG